MIAAAQHCACRHSRVRKGLLDACRVAVAKGWRGGRRQASNKPRGRKPRKAGAGAVPARRYGDLVLTILARGLSGAGRAGGQVCKQAEKHRDGQRELCKDEGCDRQRVVCNGKQAKTCRQRRAGGARASRMVEGVAVSRWCAAFGRRNSRRAAALEGVDDAQAPATLETRMESKGCVLLGVVLVVGVG